LKTTFFRKNRQKTGLILYTKIEDRGVSCCVKNYTSTKILDDIKMDRFTSRQIALIAVFAALYYVLSLITPYIPAIGIADIKISLEALIATVFGILMGPYLGCITAFTGATVAWVLPPSGMSPLGVAFIFAPALNALVTGFVYYKKWKYAVITLAVLILAFLLLPPSQPLTEYGYVGGLVVWDKVIALLLIIPTVKFAKYLSSSKKLLPILFFLIGFIGNQADNMWGSMAFAVPVVYNGIYGLDIETVRFLFTVSPLVYPAIRIIQAIIVVIIVIPLLARLKNTGWVWKEETIID
jgi:hypothetical protein